MARRIFLLASLVCLLAVGVVTAAAAAERAPRVLASIWENDLLFNPAPGQHQDRHYTQGLKLVYLDRGEPVPGWARALALDRLVDRLPTFGLNPVAENYGVAIGQNLYTPEDNRATNVIVADRPYAGWLYVGLAVQRRGASARGRPMLDSLELNLGVIGPEALGEQAQNWVHQWRRLSTFDGWANQLRTEPAFVFKAARAWKWTITKGSAPYFDVIPQVGANLGTVMVSGELGVTARLGVNLPDDFGAQTIDAPILLSSGPARWGLHAFGRLAGRTIGRNVFLDGNLYRDSHRVDKRPLVADLSWGLAVTLGRHCEISWTAITRTREFSDQLGFDEFGSLSGKLRWAF